MLQQQSDTPSFLARHTRLFCQSIPVVGPMFQQKSTWHEAFENSGRGLTGLLGGASLMFFNALYGIDLMDVNVLVSLSAMITMMEVGDKGGRALYNLSFDSINYIVKTILEEQPELTEHFAQWKRQIIQPAMEPGMLLGGVFGMWLGMETMPIKSDDDSDLESALVKTANMEMGMLPFMALAMAITHEIMACCPAKDEENTPIISIQG